VQTALASAGFDEKMFYHRGGQYDWGTAAGAEAKQQPGELSW
jgi:hypothetical protein